MGGEEGWTAFLTQIISPVIKNDLRTAIGAYKCADLIPSRALVQNSSSVVDPAAVNGQGNVNLSAIEAKVADSLVADLKRSLGGDYLTGINFSIIKVDLPEAIQTAINAAQAAYAAVSSSEANVKQAELDAQADAQRQAGYDACRACAQIDILKALPAGGGGVFAPGSSTGLPLATDTTQPK